MNILLSVILITLFIACNFEAIREQQIANVRNEFMGSHIKINHFTMRDKGMRKHTNIKNYFLYLETSKEYYYKETSGYNESVAIEMLCYGTNLPVNHTLTWHVLVGSQEIATLRRDSSKPNSNFTLYYNLGIYDNETRFYCSVDLAEAMAINSDDLYVQMNYILETNYLHIAFCNVSRGFIPRKRCKWSFDAVGTVNFPPTSDVTDADYAEGFDYIVPEYYNTLFSTVTHNCIDGDTALIKPPNGTASITSSESFPLTKSDNGTVLFCVRFNRTVESENGPTSLTIVTRDAYNERICLFNENVLLENKIKSSIIIAMITSFIIIIVGINVLGIILWVHRRMRKRKGKPQKRNTVGLGGVDLVQHLNDILKKWKR